MARRRSFLPTCLKGDSYAPLAFETPRSAGFHSYTHDAYRDPSDAGQAEVRNKLLDALSVVRNAVASLLTRRRGVQEREDRRMLDNTLVVWGTEVAEPDVHRSTACHSSWQAVPVAPHRSIPIAAASNTRPCSRRSPRDGLPDARFGHPDFAREPLRGLLR